MRIDIRAKELAEDCRVWRAFPGKSYNLLDAFVDHSTVFLEFPNLSLEAEFENDEHLAAKVHAAQLTADQKRDLGPDAHPRIRWQEYRDVHVDSALGRRVKTVVDLFANAKKGDLVIVPNRKGRNDTRIGVFSTDPSERIFIEGASVYTRYFFPARQIEWLAQPNEERFSPQLTNILRHEHAFVDIGSDLYNEVFSLAYGNFISSDVYSALVTNGNNDFTDSDNALVGVIFTLSAYACQAYENGDETFEVEDIFDFILHRPPREYACHFASLHNSPGFTRYIGEKGTALVAAAVIAGLLALPSDANAAQIRRYTGQIELVNSQALQAGLCDPNIAEPVKILYRSIGGDKLRKACQSMQETARRAEVRVRARPTRGQAFHD